MWIQSSGSPVQLLAIAPIQNNEVKKPFEVGVKPCWASRLNGKYVSEGHGSANECFDFATARTKCEEATDCHAIATQNNVCNGQYRVTHGGPTLVTFDNWQPYDLWAYTLDRTCLAAQVLGYWQPMGVVGSTRTIQIKHGLEVRGWSEAHEHTAETAERVGASIGALMAKQVECGLLSSGGSKAFRVSTTLSATDC